MDKLLKSKIQKIKVGDRYKNMLWLVVMILVMVITSFGNALTPK
ncbi:MAG: hypothetical protein AABY22_36235 [Nanoarchaeota archaeon]